jgi:hypothetical protein
VPIRKSRNIKIGYLYMAKLAINVSESVTCLSIEGLLELWAPNKTRKEKKFKLTKTSSFLMFDSSTLNIMCIEKATATPAILKSQLLRAIA